MGGYGAAAPGPPILGGESSPAARRPQQKLPASPTPRSPQHWGARGGGTPHNSTPAALSPLQFVIRHSSFVISLALALFLVLYPLLPLARYYRDEAARDPANATFLETVRIVREARGPGTPVLLDRNGLVNVDLLDGASALEIIDVLLILDGVPHVVTRTPGDDAQRLAATVPPGDTAALPLVIMMRDECFRIRDRVSLQRISGRLILRELYPSVPSYYGVYRFAPAGQPGGCLPAGGATPGD